MMSKQVKECREALEDSIAFAMYINTWLDNNPEYKAQYSMTRTYLDVLRMYTETS